MGPTHTKLLHRNLLFGCWISLTDFVVTSLLRVSEEVLQRQRMIHLSNRDRDLFLTALEADVRPNRASSWLATSHSDAGTPLVTVLDLFV